jgi:hypothetical protein
MNAEETPSKQALAIARAIDSYRSANGEDASSAIVILSMEELEELEQAGLVGECELGKEWVKGIGVGLALASVIAMIAVMMWV